MAERIPISWLHSHAYCEYTTVLEHVEGIEAEITLEMQQGIDLHAALDEAHKEKAELELTVTDALAKAKAEEVVLTAREVYVEGENVIGCIDEVVFMPDRILIVDDKPGDVAWLSSRRQIWGYCLAFEEQYKPELPIVAVLRNRDTGKDIWSEPFLQEQREEVLTAIGRIVGILSGEITEVQVTGNPNKCRACRLRASCDVRVE